MKTAGLHLLAFAVAGTLAAQDPAAPGPVKTSLRLQEEIRTSLPPFTPPPRLLDQPHDSGTDIDPDFFALPKFTVREKRQQRIEPNDLLTPRALNKKFAVDYKKSLRGLDAVLNGFSIPLVSPSLAARGRAAFRAGQFEDIRHVIAVGQFADPQNSGSRINEKTDLFQPLDWQNRPAGDGRTK